MTKGMENIVLHRQWTELEKIIQFLVFLKNKKSSEIRVPVPIMNTENIITFFYFEGQKWPF